MNKSGLIAAVAALTSFSACSGESGGRDSASGTSITTTGSESDSATTTTTSDGSDSSSTSGSDSDSSAATTDTPPKFDVGNGDDLSTGGDSGSGEGCTKVDLLFVIDDSGSMADNQASLIASFPGFVGAIQSQLANTESYNIGVVTTDAYADNASGCKTLGDLVTQTGGTDSSNMNCLPFTSGGRYMDDSEPDLVGKFACAAQVGTDGDSNEIMIQPMLNALSPAKNGAGACNEGFGRLDALLVVVIITDEEDEPAMCFPQPIGCQGGTEGTPPEWYNTLVGYRGNIPENIVILSLVGTPGNSCGAEEGTRIIQFTNNFGANGFVGDICAGDFSQFFSDAVGVVDTACDNFKPPG